MATEKDKLELVKDGFVAGFLYAYNDAKKTADTGFDAREIRLFAERQAIEHVALLKSSGKYAASKPSNPKPIPEQPLDKMFEAKD